MLTSGCGYTFYRDSLFDDLVAPSVYFSCPVHNCVHREVISWNGVLMESARAGDEAQSEFLRSSDSWFRPASIRTGPDGGMYIADLYRLVIEHPQWIDDTLERKLIADGRLRAGYDRGRIYKVFPEGANLRKQATLTERKPADLAAALDSPNGWQRDTAHMMLTWLSKNEQRNAIPALVKVLESEHPAARAQALSALADLEALSATAMQVGLDDSHPGVRRNALRVGAHLFNIDAALGQRAATLLNDDDAHVQRQAAYALGSWKDPRAGQALARFLVKNADRPYLRAAALTSAGAFPDEVLLAVLGMGRTPVTTAISTELMGMLGEDAKKFVPRVLGRIAAKPAGGQSYEAWKLIAATRLLEAVGADNSVRAQVGPMLAGARAIVDNEKEELARRIAAVQLIERAAAKPADDVDRLAGLLKLTSPVELQVAATQSLLRHEDTGAARRLLAGWSERGPAVRSAMIDALLARPKLTGILLGAIAKNGELAASVDISRRQLLLRHEDESIRITHAAMDAGINFIDNANYYGKGVSEEILGKALAQSGKRDEAVVATKVSGPMSQRPNDVGSSRYHIMQECDRSLKRLGTDRIDLYYLHRWDKKVPIGESVGSLAEMADAGKIGAIGLSEVSVARLREAQAVVPIAAVQNEYSLWTRNAEWGMLDATRASGVAFVAFSPVARGFLADAVTDPETFAPKDIRRAHPRVL